MQRINAEGIEVWASCPLGTHSDSDPSFQVVNDPVSEQHGYWRCFGCHEGGGPIGLVRRLKGWTEKGGGAKARTFLDAFSQNVLADAPVVETVRVEHALLPIGVPPFRPTDRWKVAPLASWPGPLRTYAMLRDLTAQDVDDWKIGYAIDGRLGMRIVFPIEDELGRLGSYSARTAVGDRKRYLTPPKAENPDPGAIFGRRYWPPPGERKVCVVVEGAINALAVRRATGLPVGALGGSNDSPAQWVHFASFDRLVMLTDPDKAGNRVAEEFALAGGPEVLRALLPPGVDAQDAGRELLRKTVDPLVGPACILLDQGN